jgi:hypothetical protein
MIHVKKLASVALAAAAAVSMTACADTYGHHDHYVAGYGVGIYADGYYDNFYGPVDTGYWGDDGVFMYRGSDQQYHRDDSGHFRKESAQGYHAVHTHAARPDARTSDHGG